MTRLTRRDFLRTSGTGVGLGRLAGGAVEADRRPVSVLFADLSGFTELGEHLDPEDVRAR